MRRGSRVLTRGGQQNRVPPAAGHLFDQPRDCGRGVYPREADVLPGRLPVGLPAPDAELPAMVFAEAPDRRAVQLDFHLRQRARCRLARCRRGAALRLALHAVLRAPPAEVVDRHSALGGCAQSRRRGVRPARQGGRRAGREGRCCERTAGHHLKSGEGLRVLERLQTRSHDKSEPA